jgi:hypothetical protein
MAGSASQFAIASTFALLDADTAGQGSMGFYFFSFPLLILYVCCDVVKVEIEWNGME